MKNENRSKTAESDQVADRETAKQYARAQRLANRFGVCTRTIRRWARKKMFATYKPTPGVALFDESEVEAYVEKSRVN